MEKISCISKNICTSIGELTHLMWSHQCNWGVVMKMFASEGTNCIGRIKMKNESKRTFFAGFSILLAFLAAGFGHQLWFCDNATVDCFCFYLQMLFGAHMAFKSILRSEMFVANQTVEICWLLLIFLKL